MQIKTASVKALQNNTEKLINDVILNDEVLYIESDGGTAVIITLDEWNILREFLALAVGGKIEQKSSNT